MRSLPTALACAASALALAACGVSETEDVRDNVDAYIEARDEGDFARVCELFSDEFRAAQGADCVTRQQKQAEAQPPASTTEIVNVLVEGAQATVDLDVSTGSAAPSRVTVQLVNEDGWKIASTT